MYNLSYDDNGNTLVKDGLLGDYYYAYDFENRLTQMLFRQYLLEPSPDEPVPVIYKYDALGRRVERSQSNVGVQRYVYDGQDVIEDLDENNQVVTSYFNGPGIDNKLRQTDGTNGNLYFTTDHLGSTTALTNDSGHVVESITYDSFGNGSGSSFTRYTYTGREFDDQAQLYYYRARWYDPQMGRFISEDPIGLGGGLNLYGYAGGNPLRFVDPMGLDWLDTILGYSAHVAAGFGDTLTGGFAQTAVQFANSQSHAGVYVPEGWSPTAAIRSYTPGGAVIDSDSTPYKIGIGGAVVWSFAMAGAGISGLGDVPPAESTGSPGLGLADDTLGQACNCPSYLGQKSGPAIPVPEGATGPTPIGTGVKYTGGSGGNGLDPRVSNLRIMDPTMPRGPSPGYPNGYANYSNGSVPTPQSVNPYTGETVCRSDPWWHIPLN